MTPEVGKYYESDQGDTAEVRACSSGCVVVCDRERAYTWEAFLNEFTKEISESIFLQKQAW